MLVEKDTTRVHKVTLLEEQNILETRKYLVSHRMIKEWNKLSNYLIIALHCIALHCIALHCIALHCIALHCIALHCIALHCTALLQ